MKAHQAQLNRNVSAIDHKDMNAPETFRFYWDGTALSNVPQELSPLLKKVGATAFSEKDDRKGSSSSESVKLCGIIQSEGVVHVFLPKCYPFLSLSCDLEKKSTVKSLLQCITEYCIDNRGSSFSALTEAGEIGAIELFPLFREILLDYMRNGLYNTQETYKRRSVSGKIDWKSTVSSTLPLISRSGKPVYPSFVTKKFSYSSSNLISDIHAAVVNEIDAHYGWWLTNSDSERIAPELRGYSLKDNELSRYVSIVKKELAGAYYDRDIRLLKNIICYLECDPHPYVNGVDIRGVRDFAPVWEHMLNKVLRPRAIELEKALPVPTYVTQIGTTEYLERKKGRLDILLQEGNLVAVVDAKYYNALNPKRAPGWPDLVKQFFYVKALQSLGDEYEVGSIFIMPLNQSNNRPSKGYVGKMIEGKGVSYDDFFPPVLCEYICPAELIDFYIRNKCHTELRQKLFLQISPDDGEG